MPDSENSGEILSDGPSASAIIQMMRGIMAAGEASVDQIALLKANLPKILDHLKEASRTDAEALKNYLDFITKNHDINSEVFSKKIQLVKELLDQEEDPEQRQKLYAKIEEIFDEEKIDREHVRSEGTRSDKESKAFRKSAVQTAIIVFSAVVIVAGVGTTILASRRA